LVRDGREDNGISQVVREAIAEEDANETLQADMDTGSFMESDVETIENMVDADSDTVNISMKSFGEEDENRQENVNENNVSDSTDDDVRDSESENVDTDSEDIEKDEQMERSEKEFEVKTWLEKTDHELFEMDLSIPDSVKTSRKYIKRKNRFIQDFVNEKDFQNSQEILQCYSQNPNVKNSKTLKRKLEHLTYEERASKLVLQSVSNSIAQTRQTPGKAAKDQVKVLVAAVTHHRGQKTKLSR
jgi:hypothetical protein